MPNVEELQTANRDLLKLLLQFNAVSELMSRAAIPVDKGKVLESIALGVRGELSFDRVGVWRFDRHTQSFIGEAASGISSELVRSLRFPLVACLPMVRQALNEGRAPLRWYDEFTALLLNIAEKAGVEPSLGKDRITRTRTGWLFEAAQALEAFLDPYMRSLSGEACGKRLERSRRRLAKAHRQNPRSG